MVNTIFGTRFITYIASSTVVGSSFAGDIHSSTESSSVTQNISRLTLGDISRSNSMADFRPSKPSELGDVPTTRRRSSSIPPATSRRTLEDIPVLRDNTISLSDLRSHYKEGTASATGTGTSGDTASTYTPISRRSRSESRSFVRK